MEQGREFLASPMSGSQEEGVWEEGVILKYLMTQNFCDNAYRSEKDEHRISYC